MAGLQVESGIVRMEGLAVGIKMEDFYDIKTLKIGGNPICLLGIFDGHGGFRAAEYLKKHLFDNLMKHPFFLPMPNWL